MNARMSAAAACQTVAVMTPQPEELYLGRLKN
jgi:hypothetical protein